MPAPPEWRGIRTILSDTWTQPTVVSEPQVEQIQYEVFVRQEIRWPALASTPGILAVVGRAFSCVVMPLYTDWVQFRKLLSAYLAKLNDYLPKLNRKVDDDLHGLRQSVSRALDRIDFLERRLALLESGQVAREELREELIMEAVADDRDRDIASRVQAAQRRAARIRGRSRSPAPSEQSQAGSSVRS